MKQLILILETNASARTDYIYIKKCLDAFYGERSFKPSPIYAGCKSKLTQQEKKVASFKERYKGPTSVIVITDVDENDDLQNQKILGYCKENDFELVWMNLDIEDVFWRKRVKKNEKGALSEKYLRRFKEISEKANLRNDNALSERHSSNLLSVIDKCL